MAIGMVLFWVLVVVGIIALVRFTTDVPQSRSEHVLATRFAHGEIDETEYNQRLSVLRAHPRP